MRDVGDRPAGTPPAESHAATRDRLATTADAMYPSMNAQAPIPGVHPPSVAAPQVPRPGDALQTMADAMYPTMSPRAPIPSNPPRVPVSASPTGAHPNTPPAETSVRARPSAPGELSAAAQQLYPTMAPQQPVSAPPEAPPAAEPSPAPDPAAEYEAAVNQWRAEVQAMPERDRMSAASILERHGDDEVRGLLEDTGLIHHPALNRLALKLARALEAEW